MSEFDEYIRQGEPGRKEKAAAWQTAIGLQDVDGLKPSTYLIEVAKKHENVYLDLCDIHRHSGIVDKMVSSIGADRILFGTDIPWYDPAYGIGSVIFSRISDGDMYRILYQNAKKIEERYRRD